MRLWLSDDPGTMPYGLVWPGFWPEAGADTSLFKISAIDPSPVMEVFLTKFGCVCDLNTKLFILFQPAFLIHIPTELSNLQGIPVTVSYLYATNCRRPWELMQY